MLAMTTGQLTFRCMHASNSSCLTGGQGGSAVLSQVWARQRAGQQKGLRTSQTKRVRALSKTVRLTAPSSSVTNMPATL